MVYLDSIETYPIKNGITLEHSKASLAIAIVFPLLKNRHGFFLRYSKKLKKTFFDHRKVRKELDTNG